MQKTKLKLLILIIIVSIWGLLSIIGVYNSSINTVVEILEIPKLLNMRKTHSHNVDIIKKWDDNEHEHEHIIVEVSRKQLSDISVSPPFPIDIVYTFAGEQSQNGQRNRYNGELRYSIRSIFMYAPWINKIYIVMSDSSLFPSWFKSERLIKQRNINNNISNIPIEIVRHSQIYRNINNSINNRNSDSIETTLHHIHGLSNYFIYFNDDFFLGSPTSYLFFFNPNGIPRFPAAKIWWNNYYNNYAKNPILSHPIIPIKHQKRLNITFNVPYRITGNFAEHLPRPYTRTSWYQFEWYYPEWFLFVESHKERFCSSGFTKVCLEELIYVTMMTYRILYRKMITNQTFSDEIELHHKHLYKVLYKNKDFEIELYKNPYPQTSKLHRWLTGNSKFSVIDLRKFTRSVTTVKPHTFCLNDVLSLDISGNLYIAELRFIYRFFLRFYNADNENLFSYEIGNGFIEPTIKNNLNDLNEILYNDFGWPLDENDAQNQVKLIFIHIPKNAGSSVEQFGLKNKILWGENFGSKEFLCKKDMFHKKAANRVCCHTFHFPPIYMYDEYNLNENNAFCIVRHPFNKLLSQYRYRLAQNHYRREEIGLMKTFYNISDDEFKDNDNYWCNIDTLNKWIIASLHNYLKMNSIRDCHFIPQYQYVINPLYDGTGNTKKAKSKEILCNHILYVDKPDFYDTFDDLLKIYGINTTDSLQKHHKKYKQKCSGIAVPENIYNKTQQLIQKIYRKDFERFNFSFIHNTY